MSACVEMHKPDEAVTSRELPWHCHIIIFFDNRVTPSRNLFHRLCSPFFTYVRTLFPEQSVNVQWLKNRNAAYKYITKEGSEKVVLDTTHPLYFDATKLVANQKSHGNKEKDYKAANVARTKALMEKGVKQSIIDGDFPAHQVK